MSFLADASIVCEVCGGKRYSEDADSIHYLNFSISEALGLTFEQARTIYINHRKIHRILQCACDLGLGYLTLGQASETLSGGESQRIKLVAELAAARKAHTLYILDEPTTGLHKADVQKLIKTLKALTAAGHSVIVIEHDPDVIVAADHLIELGPGAGDNGGRIIFQGHPHELPGAATPWGRIVQHFLQ
jgi:excinuclease ABC subunit A